LPKSNKHKTLLYSYWRNFARGNFKPIAFFALKIFPCGLAPVLAGTLELYCAEPKEVYISAHSK